MKLVSFFKKVIKKEFHPKFENVFSNNIKLWKVDIFLKEENKKLFTINTKININIKKKLNGIE